MALTHFKLDLGSGVRCWILEASEATLVCALRAPSLASIQIPIPEPLSLQMLALNRPRPVIGGVPCELVIGWRRVLDVYLERRVMEDWRVTEGWWMTELRALVDAAGRGGWVRVDSMAGADRFTP